MSRTDAPEVYTPRELAAAIGVPVLQIDGWIADGLVATVHEGFVGDQEATRLIRRLAATRATLGPDARQTPALIGVPALFARSLEAQRSVGLPTLLSTAVHALGILAIVIMTTIGAGTLVTEERIPPEPARLVYLTTPGPGGGGGGGGRGQPEPPPKAEQRAPRPRPIVSPVPSVRPPRVVTATRRPVLNHEPQPLLLAPVVSLPGNLRNRLGILASTSAAGPSQGSGTGGGAGSGSGIGLGDGDGPGLGPGSGGGVGGGPYRPGSGVEPPRLLREVKPRYSEEARRANVEGDVVLEVIILADGSVGQVVVRRSLGYGLDARAVEAVQQWRFSPATRQGVAVDVIVEVAVEFVLR